MDSYTISSHLLHLFCFLQLPSLQHYNEVHLETYYICFEDYTDFLLFQLHNQIGLLEKLYFLYFHLAKHVHILRLLLFTLFIIIVATAFIPISPSPSASHCISLAIKSLSENAMLFHLYNFIIFLFSLYCYFFLQLLYINYIIIIRCEYAGIGRQACLRGMCVKTRMGSSPITRTSIL